MSLTSLQAHEQHFIAVLYNPNYQKTTLVFKNLLPKLKAHKMPFRHFVLTPDEKSQILKLDIQPPSQPQKNKGASCDAPLFF